MQRKSDWPPACRTGVQRCRIDSVAGDRCEVKDPGRAELGQVQREVSVPCGATERTTFSALKGLRFFMAYQLFMPSSSISYLAILLLWVSNVRMSESVHHCLAAHRICSRDSSCSTLMQIVGENCGRTYESACAASDLLTCKTSLKALQLHKTFQNYCICTDEISDTSCHNFYNYIFRNPCLAIIDTGVNTDVRDRDEPSEVTPSCTFALNICHNNAKCKRVYEYFKRDCGVHDAECHMQNRTRCRQSMSRIQLTPMHGCHCHSEIEHDRCISIQDLINRHPCSEELGLPTADSSGSWDPTPSTDRPDTVSRTRGRAPSSRKDNIPSAGSARPHPSVVPPPNPRRPSGVVSVFDDNDASVESQVGRPLWSPAASPPPGHLPPPPLPSSEELEEPSWAQSETTSPHTPRRRPTRVTLSPQDAPYNSVGASTCARAQDVCEADSACNLLLERVYRTCNGGGNGAAASSSSPSASHCNHTECMAAIRNLYHLGNPDKTFDIAFCSCRHEDDACLVSQRQVHPACAQILYNYMPGCDEIAEACLKRDDCKFRLQRFVESCAVDRTSYRCQGSSRSCQEALVGLLGTPLRTACGCSGNNIVSLYKCTDWQRTVWLNPCVVQAHKDFLENRLNAVPMPPRPDMKLAPLPALPPLESVPVTPAVVALAPAAVSKANSVPSTTTTTSTVPPTTTLYCVLQGKDSVNIMIRYGYGRRVYHKDDPDCSSICMCDTKGELICKVLPCDERLPCQTNFAVYSHASPAYQAYRGRCMCYSGNFICMKPSPLLYNLRQGVFMFLGYSELEEQLLNPYNQLSILDSVRRLQEIIEEHRDENGGCKLELYKHIGENIVMQAMLDEFAVERDNNSLAESMVVKEKELCYPQLKNLTDLINSNDPYVRNDVSMSLFKLAEVEVHVRQPSGGHSLQSFVLSYPVVYQTVICVLVFTSSARSPFL